MRNSSRVAPHTRSTQQHTLHVQSPNMQIAQHDQTQASSESRQRAQRCSSMVAGRPRHLQARFGTSHTDHPRRLRPPPLGVGDGRCVVTKKSHHKDSRALNVVWSSIGAHECPTGAMWVGAQIAACVATANCQSLQGGHDSSPRHQKTLPSVCSSCGAALIEKVEFILVHTGCMTLRMNSAEGARRGSRLDASRMCLRADGECKGVLP